MQAGANTYYYHYDGLGSVTEITDDSGSIVENYTYDPFGAPSVTTSTINNRYRFTGREYEEESGLYHYRARAYLPTIGRFMQRDPMGNVDSENLYQYTLNNPINYTDPSGQLVDTAADLAFIAYDLHRLVTDSAKGCKGNLKENLATLGGDIIGAFIPGLTGVGLGIRAINTGEKVVGTTIKGFTKHEINRAIERGVKPGEILDAVRNPRNVKKGKDGVTRYIGKDSEVRINTAGEVVSVIRFKKPTAP